MHTFSYGTDFHLHVRSQQTEGVRFNGGRALMAVESAGLGRAWILSQAYQKRSRKDAERENDFVIAEAKKHPSQLVPAISVPPRVPWARTEIVRAHAAGGRALKLHSMAAGLDLTKPDDLASFEKLFVVAEMERLPILVHAAFHRPGEAQALVHLAERHPKTRVIIGHLLGRDIRLLTSLRGRHIFVEISGLPFLKTEEQRAAVVGTIRRAGTWRFLFGSDWPLL
jgi:predicted TIM-barrel fold metal-dependent hydrolase